MVFWFATSAYRVQSDFIRIQSEIAAPFGAGIVLAMILWTRGATSSQVTLSLFLWTLLGMTAGSFAIGLLSIAPATIAPRMIINAIAWLPASLWALAIVRLIALRYEKPDI